jgi:predicted metal-dependent HD superfamily phosphohydrolase
MEKVLEIGKHENCTVKDLELLQTAALWHDIGYINIYKGHEEESCRLAAQFLPGYAYSNDDIDSICSLIMATKIPQSPKNKLEEIIADADLEYLGTGNAAVLANRLFHELKALNPLLTEEEWKHTEIRFLETHPYFTRFCKENKEHIKQDYLKSLANKKT